MPTPEKAATIAELARLLQGSQLAVVTNYRGLNVAALGQLRRTLRGKAELHVTKNTLLELAVSWLARRPQVASVIAGATKPEQVEQNVRAASWALTDEEMQAIDRMTA